MGRRTLVKAVATILLLLASAALACAQDFQKSYNLEPGGTISVSNVSGDIHLIGYEGSAVTVAGFKEGRDREQVEVEDLSAAGRVELRVKYPRECNCDASIRFEVHVPRSVNFNFDRISTASGNISAEAVGGRIELHTASGDVTLQGVSGEVRAQSASGSVKVRDASGSVNASTASGNVDVELARLEGSGDMRFSSASGDVSVRLPSSLDARVDMSTASGSIDTDFPLEVRKDRYSSGYTARGQLGSGSRVLRISSASGDLKLKSL
ncbi:MAG TPA: DUF4097 family beta strand repeat-containing protein [Pyrinomonadaceae bacterium]|jgi:hypothetical protein|nr:DUF4097 family beta strand repeat-containing protein [Pyrinomonadaceae bacterium]